jgi:threonyl-tRNA synthetase
MLRVRQITMDDAHIFCTEDQILQEITGVLGLVKEFYADFGFEPSFFLSTRPDKAMGTIEQWNAAEKALEQALIDNKLKYKINPKDGVFYGPKIDIHIKDALKRDWQMATIQLDYQMPERFELTYDGHDGLKHRPVMIHRAIFGSFERFLGILTEHHAGNFPFWITPIQVVVLPITENQNDYALALFDKMKARGLRCEKDLRSEKIGYKIREWENKKVPYMLIAGEKEKNGKTISVRAHMKGDLGSFDPEVFMKSLEEENKPISKK